MMPWSFDVDGSSSPLSSRGWVLQERILSPRTLHYGREQMIWECRTSISTESRTSEVEQNWPYGSPRGWNWGRNKQFVLSLEGSRSLDLTYGPDGQLQYPENLAVNLLLMLSIGTPSIYTEGQPLRGPRTRYSDHMGPYTNWRYRALKELAGEPESIYKEIPASPHSYYRVKRPLYIVAMIQIRRIIQRLLAFVSLPVTRLADVGAHYYLTRRKMYERRIHLCWLGITENYSARLLTKSEDKLVALSGLASAISTFLKDDQYVAGMWKSNLISGLLWRVKSEPGKRLATYCAPSWSWASVDGPVHYQTNYFGESGWPVPKPDAPFDQAKIVTITLEPKSSDVYGQLCGGSITLQGQWYNIKIQKEFIFQENNQYTTTLELQFSFGSAREEYQPTYSINAEDKSMVFLKETKYKHSNHRLLCYFDEKYDASALEGDDKWISFSLLRVWGRYWMMLKRKRSREAECWRRIGLAHQGKYSRLNPAAKKELRSVTIV